MKTELPVSAKIKIISNAYDRVLNNHMQSFELTSSQSQIIGFLIRNGGSSVCQRNIEAALGLKHPTVTGLLSRLESKGFVVLCSDENDKRCKRISLTQKSLDVYSEAKQLITNTDAALFDGISHKEREAFEISLDRIFENAKRSGFTSCTVAHD